MTEMEKGTDALLVEEISGYCRISVDEELDKDNTSIENQKSIIEEFVKKKFPKCKLSFYVDRDRSGYTFEQREGYQKLRKRLLNGEIKILIVKDFSRFSRRNSKGLVELEDLRDAGVRIISIGDTIDYPTFDDWMAIQFRFLINEMPVTDASKKVRSVIRRMQEDGKWINVVPYGYIITNMKKQEIAVVPDEAEVVRKIFSLYNEGWGYKRIANYLTGQNIPTPRMKEKERIEARGDEYKRKRTYTSWSIVTVQELLTNDFYIGTLRQHKYKRKKINGTDVKVAPEENYVFENHHEPIIDNRTWILAQDLLKQRSKTNYRGIKKYDNVYSGFMFCGDCGSPMFSMSRGDLAPAYTCGTYHKRGLKGCSSHHTRVDMLDAILKEYVKKVRDNSDDMIKQLENAIKNEATEVQENENTISLLERHLRDAKEELKAIKKRKIKELAKLEAKLETNPAAASQIEIIEDTYVELEDEATLKISGLQNQINLTAGKRNEIIRINRLARTVIDVFDDILNKPNLDRIDLQLIIDRIIVYEDHIDVKLKADVDALLHAERRQTEELSVNFDKDSKVILNDGGRLATLSMAAAPDQNTTNVRLKTRNQAERLFTVNVISSGDPLEIYTDREGEIILKKYSPIGEMGTFARQYAESMAQVSGHVALISDRDQFIAVSGGMKNLLGKSISRELEEKIDRRESVVAARGDRNFIQISTDLEDVHHEAISPIICEGDVIGSVILLETDHKSRMGEVEQKLIQSAAGFLGRQMEQ
ncbi:MAG: recombinase family protein [Bacteroidales bacterium]|nr:recombinase family protein [Bacteroidales bacterium]MCM1416880.1 recombinase family protein [bacterium]MCM1424764.1 recombinase family protein [bacterium]